MNQIESCNEFIKLAKEHNVINIDEKFEENFVRRINDLKESRSDLTMEGKATIFIPDLPAPIPIEGLFNKSDEDIRKYAENIRRTTSWAKKTQIVVDSNTPGAIEAWVRCIEISGGNQPLKLEGTKQGKTFTLFLRANKNTTETQVTEIWALNSESKGVEKIENTAIGQKIGRPSGGQENKAIAISIDGSAENSSFYCRVHTADYDPIEFYFIPPIESCEATFNKFDYAGSAENGKTLIINIPKTSLPKCMQPEQLVTLEGIVDLSLDNLKIKGENTIEFQMYSLDNKNEVASGTTSKSPRMTLSNWWKNEGKFKFFILGKIDSEGKINLQCKVTVWHELNKHVKWSFTNESFLVIKPATNNTI